MDFQTDMSAAKFKNENALPESLQISFGRGNARKYIESQTRDMKRTDVIVDYRGEQYIIEAVV